MLTYEEIREDQNNFLKELKKKKKPYFVDINGVKIILFSDVFLPSTDSKLMIEYIKVSKNDKILDLTTGCGLFSVIAGLQGATGVAVDINPEAVKNANENFKRFDLRFKAVKSDFFQNIPKEKFDYIFSNGPYIEGNVTEPLEYAFFGARKYIDTLFRESSKYLKKNGKMLITFAEWGEIEYFEKTAKNSGYKFRVLGKKSNTDGKRVYRLYELTKKES
ncbi:hypothetical protein COV11_02290 [Candidatus Woesearchaeota archaeon CG10_big_fil_rev_8_21_14_0_10_30_7]|nr:MAG: hypothetical protein COV11_02290 [Candidatus Woesearchaeota archaeon CG10_big_fil_rev_8_21_14_0_10_30_7]